MPMSGLSSHQSSRQGSALLLVLVVMLSCSALLLSSQSLLSGRIQALRIREAEQEMEAALLLALEDALELRDADLNREFDHPSEDWAQPQEWLADTGVRVRYQLIDASSRFSLNNLNLEDSAEYPRSSWHMLESLADAQDLEPERPWGELKSSYEDESRVWTRASQIVLLDPALAGLQGLSGLPAPRRGPARVNLNTVEPGVLLAMCGPQLSSWVSLIVRNREKQPLRDSAAVLSLLPPPAQPLVGAWVDVKTDWVWMLAEAEYRGFRKDLQALIRRDGTAQLEVMTCRW